MYFFFVWNIVVACITLCQAVDVPVNVQLFEASRNGDFQQLQRILKQQPEIDVNWRNPDEVCDWYCLANATAILAGANRCWGLHDRSLKEEGAVETPVNPRQLIRVLNVIRKLVDNGALVNVRELKSNLTSLMMAAQLCPTYNNTAFRIVTVLLENNATVERLDKKNNTALLMAAQERGRGDVLKLLLDRGANVNQSNVDGDTALSLSAYFGDVDAVKLLLDAGADIDAKTNRGNTALMLATKNGYVAVARLLVERGASVHLKNDDKWTVLMFAAANGKVQLARMFVERGADLDERNGSGYTALMIAAFEGYGNVAKLLINRGADKTGCYVAPC